MNPRVTFDGLNFWISVPIEVEDNQSSPSNEGIGIDLGIKDLAICSDKSVYKNINNTHGASNMHISNNIRIHF